MKYLGILVSLVLLALAVPPAAPQTPRSVPTIDASWLRRLAGEADGVQGDVVQEERENGNELASGTASGAMEEENMAEQGRSVTESPAIMAEPTHPPAPPTAAEETTGQPVAGNHVNSTSPPQDVTAAPFSSSSNATTAPDATPTATQNGPTTNNTGLSNAPTSNAGLSNTTTSNAGLSNATTSNTGLSNATTSNLGLSNATTSNTGLSNAPTSNTGLSNATTSNTGLSDATTGSAGAETNETSTVSPSVSGDPGSTARIPAMTAGGGGDTAGRGSELDLQNNARQQAWGAVLATAVAVACVGLVAYIIMKKRYPKGFSHRKLVEEYPSDPVLRLDNSEPLDLNFGHLGYHNPGLHGDDIQMSRIPGRP